MPQLIMPPQNSITPNDDEIIILPSPPQYTSTKSKNIDTSKKPYFVPNKDKKGRTLDKHPAKVLNDHLVKAIGYPFIFRITARKKVEKQFCVCKDCLLAQTRSLYKKKRYGENTHISVGTLIYLPMKHLLLGDPRCPRGIPHVCNVQVYKEYIPRPWNRNREQIKDNSELETQKVVKSPGRRKLGNRAGASARKCGANSAQKVLDHDQITVPVNYGSNHIYSALNYTTNTNSATLAQSTSTNAQEPIFKTPSPIIKPIPHIYIKETGSFVPVIIPTSCSIMTPVLQMPIMNDLPGSNLIDLPEVMKISPTTTETNVDPSQKVESLSPFPETYLNEKLYKPNVEINYQDLVWEAYIASIMQTLDKC